MKKWRLVMRNHGNGGADFYEIQHRLYWWWPFWTVEVSGQDYENMYREYHRMVDRTPVLKHVVLMSD